MDFRNGPVRNGSPIKDRHPRSVPPTRAARPVEHIPASTYDPPHGAVIWHAFDPADKIEQPVIKRAASIHLKIDPAVQPFDNFKNLGCPVVHDKIVRAYPSQLRMR